MMEGVRLSSASENSHCVSAIIRISLGRAGGGYDCDRELARFVSEDAVAAGIFVSGFGSGTYCGRDWSSVTEDVLM